MPNIVSVQWQNENGITLIASVMAHRTPKTRFRDAAALLNYGFSKCILYTDDVPEKLKPLEDPKGSKAGGQSCL